MKIKAVREVLLSGIQKVQNVITSKASLPILSNILIETQPSGLRLTATDLDIGITCVIPVEIQEQGAISLPAKRFSEIIKELPGENVEISTKKNNVVSIEADSCQFKIMGLGKEEFPRLPELQDKQVVVFNQCLLKEMLGMTAFAVSFDETRYILNGILFKMQKNNLVLVEIGRAHV